MWESSMIHILTTRDGQITSCLRHIRRFHPAEGYIQILLIMMMSSPKTSNWSRKGDFGLDNNRPPCPWIPLPKPWIFTSFHLILLPQKDKESHLADNGLQDKLKASFFEIIDRSLRFTIPAAPRPWDPTAATGSCTRRSQRQRTWMSEWCWKKMARLGGWRSNHGKSTKVEKAEGLCARSSFLLSYSFLSYCPSYPLYKSSSSDISFAIVTF